MTLQWNHSAVYEDWFVSPWMARDKALALHFELHPFDFQVPMNQGIVLGMPAPRFRSSKGLQVHFSDNIELLIYECDTLGAAGSTAEEPLPLTMLSPATCALHSLGDPDVLDWKEDSKPMDFGSDHVTNSSIRTTSLSVPNLPNFDRVPPVDALPHWWRSLRSLFDDVAVTENEDEGPVIYLQTWFLHGHFQRQCMVPRVLRLDQFWHHWLNDIFELWRDCIENHVPVAVGIVQPTPPLAPLRFHAAHLIVHQSTEEFAVDVFTLLFHGIQNNAFGQFALASQPLVTGLDLMDSLRIQRQCDVAERACVLQYDGDYQRLEDVNLHLRDYTSVVVHIDHPAFAPRPTAFGDVDDAVSFLAAGGRPGRALPVPEPIMDNPLMVQQNDDDVQMHDPDEHDSAGDDDDDSSTCSSAERTWYPVTAFSPDMPVGEGWANWINYYLYRRNIARIIGLEINQILQIYHVRWPPANIRAAGRQAVIVDKQGDLPLGSTHKHVLIDVEFHPHRPCTLVEFVRGAYMVPDAFTRSNLLTFLGLAPYCEMNRNRCLVSRNHVPIALQDHRLIHCEHGDFLRIVVPPTPDRLHEVPTRPAAHCAQLGIPARRLLHFYIHNDIENDLDNMPTAYAGGFVDEMNLQQLTLQLHHHHGPHLCHREDDPGERRAAYVDEGGLFTPLHDLALIPPQFGFEGDVFLRWHHFAQLGPGNMEQFVRVRTWYNDHIRWPICDHFRDANLFEDATAWRRELIRIWQDRIDPNSAIEFHIVDPDPVEETDQVAMHIIIVQQPLDDCRSILASVLDNTIWNGLPRRWALRSSLDPTGLETVALMGYRYLCPPHVMTTQCRLWCRNREIALDERYLTQHGLALTLRVQRHDSDSADDAMFLQTKLDFHQRFSKIGASMTGLQNTISQISTSVDILPEDTNVEQSTDSPIGDIKIPAADIFGALDRFDKFFLLPKYYLRSYFDDHPWLTTWWDCVTPVTHVWIYHDGSHCKEGTGAAVAAFLFQPGYGWVFGGALALSLPADIDSYGAELRGALLAVHFCIDLLKLLALVQPTPPEVLLLHDNVTVGNQIIGKWDAVADAGLAALLRHLVVYAEHRFHLRLCSQYVAAHTGEVGNEIVDSLANQAAQGNPLMDLSAWYGLMNDFNFRQHAAWFWTLYSPQLCEWWVDGFFRLPCRPSTSPTLAVLPHSMQSPPLHESGMFDGIIGTCNVLTLKSTSKSAPYELAAGLVGPTRQQIVFAQFKAAKVCIFSLQETRLRRMCHQLDDYEIFRGDATPQGHFGVLVAISTSIPYGHRIDASGKRYPLYFNRKDISVIATDERFVLLRLRTPWFRCIIVAAHAPHSGNDVHLIESWWARLSNQIPAHLGSWPIILLADANAKVGSDTCAQIGDHGAEVGGDKAVPFTAFVREHNIWLPGTFACHTGPTGTWRHHSGRWLRNDFVGLSTLWPIHRCTSWVADDIDISLHHEDHRVALVHFVMDLTAPSARHHAPLRKFHAETADLTSLRSAIGGEPDLDVHSHAMLLQQQISACLPRTEPVGPRKRKTSLSSATWQLVLQKKKWRLALWEANDLQRATFLQAVFLQWKQLAQDVPVEDIESSARGFQELFAEQDRVIAKVLFEFRAHGRLVTKASRADDAAFYQHLLKEGSAFLAPSDARQLWKVIKRALPKYQQRKTSIDPLRLLKFEDDWNPHFEALEAGRVIAPHALLDGAHCQHIEARLDCPPTFSTLPTLFDLEHVLRSNKVGKATGFDPFPSALYHCHAAELAEHAFPLLLKVWLWGEEPLQFKGGPMALIPKRPQPTMVQHFRGILLLPTLAKSFHALLRKEIIKLLHHRRLPGQLGGFARQEVLFGSQTLRLLGRAAQHLNLNMGVLFIDLSTAFHCLIREMVVGISDPRKLQLALDALSAADGNAARQHLGRALPGLLAELGAPPHLIRLLQSVHDSTWTTINGQGFIRTHRGTRPGSPLADAIFHYIMFDFSRCMQQFLHDHGHTEFIMEQTGMEVDMVIWSDDLAIPILTLNPADLLPAMMALLDFARAEFASRGFQINLGKGKTSIVATFCGAGAADTRRKFQLIPQPGIHHSFSDGVPRFVHLAPAYRHLGTLFTSDQKLDAEIAYRIGTAMAAFEQVRKRLLVNRHLPLRLRLQLFNALILSKLFFSSGSWHTPTGRQIGRLRAVIVRMLRKILRECVGPGQLSAARVLNTADVLDPRVRLAVERLLYAQRLFHHGPAFLQLNVHAEDGLHPHSWLTGLRHDLQWLNGVDINPDPTLLQHDLTDLIDLWQQDRGKWKRRVRRACRRHLFQESMILEAQQWHAEIFAVLRSAHFAFLPDPAVLQMQQRHFPCPDCHRQFDTPQGVHLHRRKAHGIFCLEHHMLDSATCPACMTFLWSTQRLQQHLAYMPRDGSPNPCFAYLQSIGYAVSYSAEAIPTVMRGQSRLDALPVAGPAGSGITAHQRHIDELTALKHRLEAEYLEFEQPADPVGAGARLGDLLTVTTRNWYEDFCAGGRRFAASDRLQDRWIDVLGRIPNHFGSWAARTFILWGKHILPDLIAELWDGEMEYHYDLEFVEFVQDLDEYHLGERIAGITRRLRLLDGPAPAPTAHRPVRPAQHTAQPRSVPQHHVQRLFMEQEQWQQDLLQVQWDDMPTDPFVPMVPDLQPRPCFVVVHLFAGRRRATDLHSWLAAWATRTNVALTVLSLDTAISPILGNLDCRSESWQMLQSLYLQGRVAATISGHPCETFSSARWHPPPEGCDPKRWPRPLRTALQLFGIDHRSLREMRQTKVGTAFFLQTLWTLACHLAYGGMFVEEHPGLPVHPDHPSVWKSALSKIFRRHPDITLNEISQWKFGATTVKPTGLLTLRMPFFLRDLYRHVDDQAVRPTSHAIGLDSCGSFRTAVHKEYPAKLSAGLACAIATQLQRNLRARTVKCTNSPAPSLVQWIHDVVADCATIRSEAVWLPDFQG